MLRRPALVPALAATVLAAGCGSTATTPATTPTVTSTPTVTVARVPAPRHAGKRALSKARFIARADAICRKLNTQQAPLRARASALLGTSQGAVALSAVAALLRRDVAYARAAHAKFAALAEPHADAATIERLLTAYSEEAADADSYANALATDDRGAWEAASTSLTAAETSARKISQRYGFKVCGKAER